MQPTDETLISQICVQDEAAFATLFVRYQSAMTRRIDKTVRDSAVTEDLVQELFLRVWTRAEQWDNRGSVKATAPAYRLHDMLKLCPATDTLAFRKGAASVH